MATSPAQLAAPMNPLQVQLLVGAAAGRRARFDRSPITFGRGPENALVVEDAYVSRVHGEIRFEKGQWWLINRSVNGTRVNRRQVIDKPQPLKSGDEIYVGDKLMFNLTLEPVEGAGADGGSLAAAGATTAKKPRSKLWMSIGGFWAVLAVIVVVLSSAKGKKQGEDGFPVMPPEKMAEFISAYLPNELDIEPRYLEHLREAERLFSRREVKPTGRFEAYQQYLLALSFSGREDDTFKPEDAAAQANFFVVRTELIEKVQAAYSDAVNRLKRGDNEGAYRGFDDVKELFGDTQNTVYKHAQELQNVATKRLGGKKVKKQ